MRVVVVGCGAIGGTLAAGLTRAGVDVTVVTGNREIADAIAENGFRMAELEGETWAVPAARPPMVSLAQRPPGPGFDLAIVATKATTLQTALHELAPHLAADAPVLVCQNGLPEEVAGHIVGASRVLGCVVVFGATMTEPGVVSRTSKGGLQIGRPAADGPDPVPVATLLELAFPVRIVEDLRAVRWSKLALNCATSTLGAVSGERLGPMLRRRHIRRIVLELWTEVVAVARASGVRPAPIGGTLDVERMALTAAERASALGSPALALKHSVLVAVGMRYRRMRSSMLVAIERGRTPEIDFLNGEIVRRGKTLGVATPINERLCALVAEIARGSRKPSLDHLRELYDEVVARDRRLAA